MTHISILLIPFLLLATAAGLSAASAESIAAPQSAPLQLGDAMAPPPPVPPVIYAAPPSTEIKSQRLLDGAAKAIPFGYMLEQTASHTPQWPIQDRPGALDDTQLTCVRAHMRDGDYRRVLRQRVDDYVSRNPTRVDDDIRVLEGGAARIFSIGFLQANATFPRATQQELRNWRSLLHDERFEPLRGLLGIAGAFGNKDPGAAERIGVELGKMYTSPMLLNALSTCNVSISVFHKN